MNTINLPFSPFRIIGDRKQASSKVRLIPKGNLDQSGAQFTMLPDNQSSIHYHEFNLNSVELSVFYFYFYCDFSDELVFSDEFGSPLINPTIEDIFSKIRLKVSKRIRLNQRKTAKSNSGKMKYRPSSVYCDSVKINIASKSIQVNLSLVQV